MLVSRYILRTAHIPPAKQMLGTEPYSGALLSGRFLNYLHVWPITVLPNALDSRETISRKGRHEAATTSVSQACHILWIDEVPSAGRVDKLLV